MNENLDLTKILEGCPEGTKFYSTVYGEVSFERINTSDEYPILLKTHSKFSIQSENIYYVKDGRCSIVFNGECTLFPDKNQRDWSKFERFWNKPKVEKVEKFDPKTLHPFDKVLVRVDKNDCWMAAHFSHVDDCTHKAVCDTFYYTQCIPYNEETKHLVGTSDDCPEYYKWWEE